MRCSSELLAAYDDQLRTDAETPGAIAVAWLGPLRLVTFSGGQGFITYRDLADADADQIRRPRLSRTEALSELTQITQVEWKTRGHDRAPGLEAALRSSRFRGR